MKTEIIKPLLFVAVLSELSACSYVKSLFPDKEKDYQYTTEIPPLILPDDLKKSRIPGLTTSKPSSSAVSADIAVQPVVNTPVEQAASAVQAANESAATLPAPDVLPESESAVPDNAITVERVKFDNGENRLRINVPFNRAWRIVSKALSRKSVEVTERNQETRVITVQYDPEEQQVKDGSYWDEVVFMFSGIQSNEQKYLLKLEENNQQTDIAVIGDEDQQDQTDAGSIKLLTLLEETIKADLANE